MPNYFNLIKYLNFNIFVNYQPWVNFFKESFLVDYIFKKFFLSYTINWFLYGSFFFNFSLLNKYQVRSPLVFLSNLRHFFLRFRLSLNMILSLSSYVLFSILLIFIVLC